MIMSRATNLGKVGNGTAVTHLFSVPTTSGRRCLLIESGASTSSSCLDSPSLFTQRPVAYLVETNGGPNVADVKSETVVGVAAHDVDALEVKLSSGDTHTLTLTRTHAFEYSEPHATIHAGDLPTKLVVLRRGVAIGSYPLTSFGK
jgi:hypothetical protein